MKTTTVYAVALMMGLAAGAPVWAADTKDAEKVESNLLQNPGFEDVLGEDPTMPDLWERFSSGEERMKLDKAVKDEGEQSIQLSTQGARNANLGVFQTVPVEPGKSYVFAVKLLNNEADPLKGTVYGELNIEWHDAEGTEIARNRSKSWGPALSKKNWDKISVTMKAPPGAIECNAVITLFDGTSSKGSKGSCWVDAVTFAQK